MRWNGNLITEHNRSALDVDVERIESSNRMSNGTLRKWVVADKRTFSCSWDLLPAISTKTVDGKWGGVDIETFYNSNPGSFTLTIVNTHATDTYTVVFTDFSKSVEKRLGTSDWWNVSITLEEV